MNEFLIRKMNIEFEEDKIRKDNISLKDKILEKAKTYKELQMIYGKIDKEVVVCKCCRDFINELDRERKMRLSKISAEDLERAEACREWVKDYQALKLTDSTINRRDRKSVV